MGMQAVMRQLIVLEGPLRSQLNCVLTCPETEFHFEVLLPADCDCVCQAAVGSLQNVPQPLQRGMMLRAGHIGETFSSCTR